MVSTLRVKVTLHYDKEHRQMKSNQTSTGNWAANTVKNTIQLAFWTGAYLVTLATATFGPIFIWDYDKIPTIVGIIINLLVGFGMIVANKRHLKGLDEMHQKIQLEAMALSLGVGLVVGLSYSLLDTTNFIAADAEISHLIILISLTYGVGVRWGLRKYQ
jgi:uncharacterized membrane protein YkvI